MNELESGFDARFVSSQSEPAVGRHWNLVWTNTTRGIEEAEQGEQGPKQSDQTTAQEPAPETQTLRKDEGPLLNAVPERPVYPYSS